MANQEKVDRIVIRKAKPYDVAKICMLLEQAVHDGEGFYPEADQIMAVQWVTTILSTGFVLVAEKGNRLVGSMALTDFRFPWSPKWYLYVDWLFVSKNFRQGGTFDALLSVAHAFADKGKMPIYGGIQSGRDPLLKDRLMRTKGYHYLGGQFMRMTGGGDSSAEYPHMEVSDGQREQENPDV